MLSLPPGDPQIAEERTAIYPTVNFLDDDGRVASSQFDGDVVFPTDQLGDDNDFVIQATGIVTIPASPGHEWTVGVNVDCLDQFSA